MAYVLNGLMRSGVAARPSDIHGALDDLVSTGELSGTHADAMKGHSGPVMVPELLQRIAAQTAQRTGQADRLDNGLSGNATTSDRGPVRSPIRWHAAREDYQAHTEKLAVMAEGLSDPDLALVIRKIAAEPKTAEKARLADGYIASLTGTKGSALVKRARATQFLEGSLLKGVD